MNRPTTRLEFFLLGILTGIIGMFAASFLRRDLPLAPAAPVEIPVTVHVVPSMSPAPPPNTEVGAVRICSLSGMRARSRCPVTQELRASDPRASRWLCSLHAKICPVNGALFPLKDRQDEPILFCPDHGARLEDVP